MKPKSQIPSERTEAVLWLRYAMEGIVLLMVAAAPWCFGAVDPFFEYLLFTGIAILGLLWGISAVIERRFLWFSCPAALSLGAILFLGLVQLLPLPSWVIGLVSPAANSLRAELLPLEPELLSANEPAPAVAGLPTISLDTHATRGAAVRLLALLLLFGAVRVNVASTESLRRLAWVCLVNGVALSLFGIIQFATTKDSTDNLHKVVMGFKTRGEVFGPFICRNHFAYYVNMCIGLGIGLVLVSGRTDSDQRARRTMKAQALVEQSAEDEASMSLLRILHSPLQLWISVMIAVAAVGLIGSMSRGGVAALVAGFAVAFALRGLPTKRAARLELLVLPVVMVLGLIAWIGIKPLESRLAGVGTGGLSTDGRLAMWKNILPVAGRFPVLGSGYGTLPLVEPLNRQQDYGYINFRQREIAEIDHAHNDYLEALVEGGVLRLAATLAFLFFLLRYGRKALKRHEQRTPGRLAFGALVAVVAVAAHSFVDFGLFTPAVAVLATVIAAQLCNSARSDPSEPPSEKSKHSLVVSLGGWGGVAACSTLVLLGLTMVGYGSKAARVQKYRVDARPHRTISIVQAVDKLVEASLLTPDDARLRAELGQLYLDAYSSASTSVRSADRVNRFVKPALHEFIAARNLSPLLPAPHARLAAFAQDADNNYDYRLAKSDHWWQYAERSIELAPYDAENYYFIGLIYFGKNQHDKAYALWRKSLERRDTRLENIVDIVISKSADTIASAADLLIEEIVPPQPLLLLRTAQRITASTDVLDPARSAARKSAANTLARQAQSLLEKETGKDDPQLIYLLGVCQRFLGANEDAVASFRHALFLDSRHAEWHLALAECYRDMAIAADDPKKLLEQALNSVEDALEIQPSLGPAFNLKADIKFRLEGR